MASSSSSRCDCQSKKSCKKAGILSCDGCNNRFCQDHIVEHRQELETDFQRVLSDRDSLYHQIYSKMSVIDSQAFDYISKWENETIETIKTIADQARRYVQDLLDEKRHKIIKRYEQLSMELRQRKEKDDFFEQDIKRLSEKLEQVKLDCQVKDLPNTVNIKARNVDFDNVFHTRLEIALQRILNENNLLKTININNSYGKVLAASENFVSYRENDQLCFFNKTNFHTTTMLWKYITSDICWCSTIKQFFIWTYEGGFTLSESLRKEKKINQLPAAGLFGAHSSCICYNNIVLLCDGPSIELWDISSWTSIKRWENNVERSEEILSVRINEKGIVGMTIGPINFGDNLSRRFELRDLLTMNIMESVEIDTLRHPCAVAMPNDEWLILGYDKTTILLIDKNCNIEEKIDYQVALKSAFVTNTNILIIRIKEPYQLRFYQL
ncbi:unnamed protein product [Didymodactylos carnosus]|uniref:Uncharacterized protein n=1 Tax=Didymodactylos carnosus TaxID=1234261 RepID=A0A815MR68_9BILA|nr:unnamed protein product [Didymodactylos carnosus]CAF4306807.1 unnamed protein product [Didymodactylos carnosus]